MKKNKRQDRRNHSRGATMACCLSLEKVIPWRKRAGMPHGSGCRSKCAKPGSACSLPGRVLIADANHIRLWNDHSSNTLHIAWTHSNDSEVRVLMQLNINSLILNRRSLFQMRGDSIDQRRSMWSIQSPKPKHCSPEIVDVSGGIEVEDMCWGPTHCGFTVDLNSAISILWAVRSHVYSVW